MKKSLVTVSIIIVLGAIWTGASWYTGKLAEQRMSEVVVNANLQIKKQLPNAHITLIAESYQRGIFSSNVRYLLRADDNESSQTVLKAGDEIALIGTISHGPFPLAQLKKFNLTPAMASVHSTLDNTPAVKKIFEIAGGKSPVLADSRIAYNGDISSEITIVPVDYQQDSLSIQFSGTQLTADIARNIREVALVAKSASLVLAAKDQEDKTEQLTLKDISINSTNKLGKFDLSIGDQQVNIGQLAISIDGKEVTTLAGLHLNVHVGETDNHLNGQLNYTLDSLNLRGNDFGSGKLIINVDKLNGQALKQLADSYNHYVMQSLQQDKNVDADAWQKQVDIASKIPALLQDNPTLNIAPFSWKNSKGESTFTLNLELTNPAPEATAVPGYDLNKLSNTQMIKNMTMAINIPTEMATELMTQIARLQGYDEEESQKLAQQQVQGLAAMGTMFKLTTTKDDAISSSFHYADNKVVLNDHNMSLPEFMGLFGLSSGLPAGTKPATSQ